LVFPVPARFGGVRLIVSLKLGKKINARINPSESAANTSPIRRPIVEIVYADDPAQTWPEGHRPQPIVRAFFPKSILEEPSNER
jgi:hypothetical protein